MERSQYVPIQRLLVMQVVHTELMQMLHASSGSGATASTAAATVQMLRMLAVPPTAMRAAFLAGRRRGIAAVFEEATQRIAALQLSGDNTLAALAQDVCAATLPQLSQVRTPGLVTSVFRHGAAQ